MLRTATPLLVALCALLWQPALPAAIAGQPDAVYLAYHDALKRSFSERGIWPFYHSAARADFERRYAPDMRSRVFFMMKTAAPREVRIEQIRIEGDRASVVLASADPNDRSVGTAYLRQEEGAWKVFEVIWRQP